MSTGGKSTKEELQAQALNLSAPVGSLSVDVDAPTLA